MLHVAVFQMVCSGIPDGKHLGFRERRPNPMRGWYRVGTQGLRAVGTYMGSGCVWPGKFQPELDATGA